MENWNKLSYIKALKHKRPDIKHVGDFKGFNTVQAHQCLTHNVVYSAYPNNVLFNSTGCPKCASSKRIESRKISVETLNKELESKFHVYNQGSVFRYETLHAKCLVCHSEFSEIVHKFLRTPHNCCPTCNPKQGGYADKLLSKGLKKIKHVGKDRYIFECSQSHQWEGYLWRVKDRGCPKCNILQSHETRKVSSPEDYTQEVKLAHNGKIKYVSGYVNRNTYCKHRCTICHHVYKALPHLVIRGIWGCVHCARTAAYKLHKVKIEGRTFQCAGYEEFGIQWILDNTKVKVDQILAHTGVPIIRYRHRKKDRIHYPDLYIPHKNIIVEIASDWTFGLTVGRSKILNERKAKAKAAIDAGYDYRVIVMTENKERIKLPADWYKLSTKIIRESIL